MNDTHVFCYITFLLSV